METLEHYGLEKNTTLEHYDLGEIVECSPLSNNEWQSGIVTEFDPSADNFTVRCIHENKFNEIPLSYNTIFDTWVRKSSGNQKELKEEFAAACLAI